MFKISTFFQVYAQNKYPKFYCFRNNLISTKTSRFIRISTERQFLKESQNSSKFRIPCEK